MLPHALLQLFCGLHACVLLSVSVQNEFTVRRACFQLAFLFLIPYYEASPLDKFTFVEEREFIRSHLAKAKVVYSFASHAGPD